MTTSTGNTDSQQEGKHLASKKHLMKAAGVVGSMTLTSRILGMIRDIVTAGRFGTTWQWDSFLYAFMLPNFLRRLVGEGAISSAFIPVYTETLQKNGKEAAFRFANSIISILVVGLSALSLLVELFIHLVLKWGILSERLTLTAELLRIFFPYIIFVSLFAFAMGILNCHQHFFTPALAPIILDIMWIAGVLWIAPMAGNLPEEQLTWLAVVLLVSGSIQFGVDIPPLLKLGFKFRWVFEGMNEGLRKTWALLLPAIMSFAIVQLNILLDMVIGYFIGPGANSSLWYGSRLMQFPLGVFGIAMGTALLPTLSHQVARKEMEEAKKTLSFALRSIFLIILPCTVGLIVLRVPIVQMLFERGEFDAVSTARTASVLMFYAIGLFSYSGEKIMASGFFAAHDTVTPVKMGMLSLAINTVFNLILMGPMKESGLAFSTAIASIVEFIVMIYFYQKKISVLPVKDILRSFFRILMASLGMGIVCMAAYPWFSAQFPGEGSIARVIQVFGSIGVSVIIYVVLCFLFRVREVSEAVDFIRKRKQKAGK